MATEFWADSSILRSGYSVKISSRMTVLRRKQTQCGKLAAHHRFRRPGGDSAGPRVCSSQSLTAVAERRFLPIPHNFAQAWRSTTLIALEKGAVPSNSSCWTEPFPDFQRDRNLTFASKGSFHRASVKESESDSEVEQSGSLCRQS
jgi:hypothetical protein